MGISEPSGKPLEDNKYKSARETVISFLKTVPNRNKHTKKITQKLTVYSGMLAFITCLKNGFVDFAQTLLVALDLC